VGGIFGLLFSSSLVRGAAAVTAIGIVALFVSGSLTSNVDTASAQVLEPGSYVELQGVVTEASAPHNGVVTVRVQAEFGDVVVDLNADGVIDEGGVSRAVSSLRKGDALVVAGQVGFDRSVAASRLAFAATAAGEKKAAVKALKALPDGFEGVVTTVAISADGTTGTAVVEDKAGQRFVVPVTAETAATLLNQAASAVGSKVTLKSQDGKGAAGVSLEVKGEANAAVSHPLPPEVPTPPARRPGIEQREPTTTPFRPTGTPGGTALPGGTPRGTKEPATPTQAARATGDTRPATPGPSGVPGATRTITPVPRTVVPPAPRTITPGVKPSTPPQTQRTPTGR